MAFVGRLSSCLALGLAAMVLAPAVSLAAPPGDDDEPQPTSLDESRDVENDVARAKNLFAKGASLYETADYDGAIELWTEAYALVPPVPEYSEAKADLIFNIATAHERAFDVEADIRELNQAKILLGQYRDLLPDIYTSTPERQYERTRVDEKLEVIQRKIDAAKAQSSADDDGPNDVEVQRRAANNLIISGAVVTALGGAGLGVATAGMAMGAGANDLSDLDDGDLDGRRDQFDRGRTGNTLAIAGGITAGVLVPVGVALLTVGVLRKKRLGTDAEVMVAPLLNRRQAGLSVFARF